MLRIGKFVTECRAPQGRPEIRPLADSIAREQLARELSARLGPSLSRQEGVVRIRSLRVRIEVRGRTIDRNRLVDAWVSAICRHLFTALAYPHGGGHYEIHRASSPAVFRAEFIRDFLSGAAQGRWIYRRRHQQLRSTRAGAVLSDLLEAPSELTQTLEALVKLGALEAALSLLDELQCEELFRAIGESPHVVRAAPWPEVVAQITRALQAHPPSRGFRLDSHIQALRMFALAHSLDIHLSPRLWLSALTAMALLADNGALWIESSRSVEAVCGRPLTPDVAALLSYARASLTGPDPSGSQEKLLRTALHAVGLEPPKQVIALAEPQPWQDFAGASLLLLTAPLMRLGWAADWRDVTRQVILYAMGCAVRGTLDTSIPEIDRDAALFAGMFEDPPPAVLRRLYSETAPPNGDDWVAVMLSLSDKLILSWGARIPGFRKAGRDAIVRQFLTAPGRVRIEHDRVRVMLFPRPVFVALRIASLDDAVDRVPWFGDRRLEFQIEGV